MTNGKNEFRSAVEQIDRLPTYIVPTNYNIKLIPNFGQNYTLEGETSTRIHIYKKTQCIHLHQYFLFIFNTPTLINEDNGNSYEILWEQHMYNSTSHILTFYLTEALSPGFYILNMKFYGMPVHPKENVLTFALTKRIRGVIWLNAVHFQPIRGRRLFPCWDEPAFKTTFKISIKHHKEYMALSNMPSQTFELADNNMIWTHFHPTPLMSTYRVAVVLATFPFDGINAFHFERETVWCRKYSAPYTKFVKTIFTRVTSHLRIRFNIKIAKLDHVVLPESKSMWNWYLRDGMSQWGFIFYRERRIMYNEAIDPPSHKIEVTRLVTYELAHHWSSNFITLSSWSYLWITDGIAGLLTVDAINKILTGSPLSDLFMVQIQHDSLNLDTHSLMKPLQRKINDIADIDLHFISVSYIKAPVIFRMLQHILTDVVFWEGINKYLNMKFSQLSSQSSASVLWTTMQSAQTKSSSKYLPNLISIMRNWTMASQYPVVNVIRESWSGNIIISQGKNTWWVPITYTTRTELNFNDTVPRHWLTPDVQEIIISNIAQFDWIILNLQQTGYYRVNYELTMWQKIAYYLNSDNYKNIHVLNRAQILDDAFYLVIEEKSLNLSTFWKLSHYLSRETDYVAWYPMIKAFEYLSIFIPFSKIGLEKEMRIILPTLFKEIGYQEITNEDDFTKYLRQEIAKWACVLGDSDCRINAASKLEWHITNPEKHKILPWWKEWTFCNGLIKANGSTWMKMMDIFKRDHDIQILEYLTCSENPNIIQIYLNKITENMSLEINDRVNIFLRIIAKHAKNIEILKYILENFEKIKPREVNVFAALTVILNHGNIEKQKNRIQKIMSSDYPKENVMRNTEKPEIPINESAIEEIQKIMSSDSKGNVMRNTEKPEIPANKSVKEEDVP
ncbi:PREDICTED: aminopeptidase N-like [Trachymyrmex cornetzi]|uniref:aminopeptidase N-like n=1 Tax=Trachymyrmex cornetzi TaxID=471704 RepID=UPI00084ED8DE|nr:PREDICTED: aminopeptidase N-like [Trachymyrmex cornetzi]